MHDKTNNTYWCRWHACRITTTGLVVVHPPKSVQVATTRHPWKGIAASAGEGARWLVDRLTIDHDTEPTLAEVKHARTPRLTAPSSDSSRITRGATSFHSVEGVELELFRWPPSGR